MINQWAESYAEKGRRGLLYERREKVDEEAQNLPQQVQEQTRSLLEQIQQQVLTSAHDFYGNSLGSLESRLANDRAQLQDLLEQLPDSQQDARAQIEQVMASYKTIEESIGQAAQEQGVEE